MLVQESSYSVECLKVRETEYMHNRHFGFVFDCSMDIWRTAPPVGFVVTKGCSEVQIDRKFVINVWTFKQRMDRWMDAYILYTESNIFVFLAWLAYTHTHIHFLSLTQAHKHRQTHFLSLSHTHTHTHTHRQSEQHLHILRRVRK